MLPLLKLYKSTIKKHNNTIKVDTSVEWAVYILLTLREMLETKPILVHFTTKNDTLPKIKLIPVHFITKNDTSPRITDSTNENATEPTKIVQIIPAKTLEIELIKVNINN